MFLKVNYESYIEKLFHYINNDIRDNAPLDESMEDIIGENRQLRDLDEFELQELFIKLCGRRYEFQEYLEYGDLDFNNKRFVKYLMNK